MSPLLEGKTKLNIDVTVFGSLAFSAHESLVRGGTAYRGRLLAAFGRVSGLWRRLASFASLRPLGLDNCGLHGRN